ncbi:MAG: SemiSWEET transporter [Ideonella sp.]|mgnify:CR=1 FL=1|nr:SemiSWEET transporter [Ideonella sp.]
MIDEWLGFGAAALTTASFLPQAWMTFRTRDASGISLAMYGAFTLGIALWLAYGIRIGAWPLIVANAVTLVLAGAVLVMKIRIERQRRRSRQG